MAKSTTRTMTRHNDYWRKSVPDTETPGGFTEVTSETLDSVELKMSAKGERYWDIKLYLDSADPASLEAALNRLSTLDGELKKRFGINKGEV